MDIAEQKARMRAAIRATRAAICAEHRAKAEAALETKLFELDPIKHARCIAIYNPVGSEAKFVSEIGKLYSLENEPVIAFPIVTSTSTMRFASFASEDDTSMLANPLEKVTGIESDRFIDPKDIDVMLVPGIAFDEQGLRLGQGGGYYDRYLPLLRDDCFVIGIAFDEQIVDAIPHEPYDQRLAHILTPTRIFC